MSTAKRDFEAAIAEVKEKLSPEERETMRRAFAEHVKLNLLNESEFWQNLFARKNFLGELYFDFVNSTLYEQEQSQGAGQPSPIKQRNRGMVTISSVIDRLHTSDLELPERERKLKRAPATLKRRVDALLVNLRIAKRFAKDDNGHYALPIEWTPVAEIFIIELSRDHSFLNKVMDPRYDEMTVLEAVEFFDRVATYIDGKMDKERQQLCLRVLDKALKY
ncbi:MAG: hypothetical protein K6T83_04680 [Alicyclobacillus sp.]|nr:hypothetical protein [Alicyclobacillus sp.]